jgi:hypothetical protein
MTEVPNVPDDVVDAVEVDWDPRPDHFFMRMSAPKAAGLARLVLENFALVPSWSSVLFLAEGAAGRSSRSTDLGGFAFPEATGLDGVMLIDGGDNQVLVSEPAFFRLIGRYFDTLVSGATADGDPVTQQPWWAELAAAAKAIAVRNRAG